MRRSPRRFASNPLRTLGLPRSITIDPIRQGFPEVVLGLGKTPDQIAKIASQIVGRGHPLLVTRADEAAWNTVKTVVAGAEYHAVARCITVKGPATPGKGTIALCSAGTSDLPVAEEAAVTAELLGNTVDRMYDVGVAGIHRVLAQRDRLAVGARGDRRGRHGRRAAERGRGHGGRAGDRRADEHRLRRQLRRRRGAARHVELVRQRRVGREHRQWLRGRLHRFDDQSSLTR